MESTRRLRVTNLLEQQFMACEELLHQTLARAHNEETGTISVPLAQLSIGLARAITQMATTMDRMELHIDDEIRRKNRRSNPQ